MKIERKEKNYLWKQSRVLNGKLRSLSLKGPYIINEDGNKQFIGFTQVGESIYNECCIERNEDYIIIDKDKFKKINKSIIEKHKLKINT